MSQELSNCYEVLGVSEGASAQELKEAYRDLAKVWHPDRFAHDPRLQQKAQEKLKEINEAYEQLASGKVKSRKQTSSGAQSHTQPNVPRTTWQIAVLPVCVFTILLLISGYLLIAGREPIPQRAAQEAESNTVEQPLADSSTDTVREQRVGRKPVPKQLPVEALKKQVVERTAGATPLPTVSLTVDTTTGLIATAHCPVKSRMTYADGTEPRQHCSLHKAEQSATTDAPQKDSRLKSFTRRLASPTRWFRGKERSDSARRETPTSQNTADQD
jgi:hypothetical protein